MQMSRSWVITGDTFCRLCGKEEETVDHIVNRCETITRTGVVSDVFSTNREDVEVVVRIMKVFVELADKKEESEETEDCESI